MAYMVYDSGHENKFCFQILINIFVSLFRYMNNVHIILAILIVSLVVHIR
jgi:hypothetical protein